MFETCCESSSWCGWWVTLYIKALTGLHQKMVPAMQGASQADIQWWMWRQAEFSCWFIFHPLRKPLSRRPITRRQMGLLTKQLWPSDSAFYVTNRPADQLTWLLSHTCTLVSCFFLSSRQQTRGGGLSRSWCRHRLSDVKLFLSIQQFYPNGFLNRNH